MFSLELGEPDFCQTGGVEGEKTVLPPSLFLRPCKILTSPSPSLTPGVIFIAFGLFSINNITRTVLFRLEYNDREEYNEGGGLFWGKIALKNHFTILHILSCIIKILCAILNMKAFKVYTYKWDLYFLTFTSFKLKKL